MLKEPTSTPEFVPFEECASWTALLRRRATEHGDRRALTFLVDGEEKAEHLTYGELDAAARAVAGRLLAAEAAGERALLLYPASLDFVIAFFGCLYAGVAAVPVATPSRRGRSERLAAILEDSGARFVLAPEGWQEHFAALQGPRPMRWILEEPQLADAAEGWRESISEDLAFLQYTSGSTARPKGVMVTHGNLLHNAEMLRRAFEYTPSSVVVSWLPMFHDMGLIGTLLQPLYAGARAVLMSPQAFLRDPIRWLRAISRYRGTISGGPNFGYQMCAAKISPEARADLDLSSWRLAFNGAEPVRAVTLASFSRVFEPCGFQPAAHYPCYGLAEATLFVTGGQLAEQPATSSIAPEALERGRVEAGTDERHREIVACGRTWLEQQVLVVDPESCELCQENRVGEIWIAGGSVAAGYWKRTAATTETFGARLRDAPEEGPFLRTGDLGFLRDGELYITGRQKDLIILRGRNHHPEDIEPTVAAAHRSLRPGGGAVFAAEEAGEERLVVVQELHRKVVPEDGEEIAAAIRGAVAREHELSVFEVVLIKAGSLPKTSSGKVQRVACRRAWQAGALRVVYAGRSAEEAALAEAEPTSRELLLELPAADRREALLADLGPALGRLLGCGVVQGDRPLVEQGLDSLSAAEIESEIEARFGVPMDAADLLADLGIGEIADRILANLTGAGGEVPLVATEDPPVPSIEQERLWLLQQMRLDVPCFNLTFALDWHGPVDGEILRRSWATVLGRHGALRSRFPEEDAGPRIEIVEEDLEELAARTFEEVTLDDLAEPEQAAEHRVDELTATPFDLAAGPLTRALLLRLGRERARLVVAVHHLVFDLWSWQVLVRDLETAYRDLAAERPLTLAPLAVTFGDFARWQRDPAHTERREADLNFWRERLSGAGAVELPTDLPREAVSSWAARSVSFEVSPDHTSELRRSAREARGTLFMTLVTAFGALISRYAEQDDLVIATPVSGRFRPEVREAVGFFAYPLLLRADFSGDLPFRDLQIRVGDACRTSYRHRQTPFAEVVAAVRSVFRGELRVFFSLLDREESMAPTQLAGPDGEIRLVPAAVAPAATDFDLFMTLWQGVDGGLRGQLVCRAELFEPSTQERLVSSFERLLAQASERPETRLSELDLEPELLAQAAEIRAQRTAEASAPEIEETVAIAASFTAEPLAQVLEFWGDQLTVPLRPAFAPFNQVFQELLSGSGVLAGNQRGFNVLLLRLEDWAAGGEAGLARTLDELVDAIGTAVERSPVPWLVAQCPSSSAFQATYRKYEAELEHRLRVLEGIECLTAREVVAAYGVTEVEDPVADEVGSIPYTPALFAALGSSLVRRMHSSLRPAYKVIAVDCDQTLWQGVCAEDGADGVRIGPSHRALQQRLVAQQEAGALIALVSKNEPEDVFAVFNRHPDMVLRRDHLVAWKIDWRPKPNNLRELAQDLDLGLDSFLFLDDNPVECAAVAAELPQVAAFRWPTDDAEAQSWLAHLWAFDRPRRTAEDQRRTELYRENAARQQSQREAPSLGEFLASLELEIEIEPLTETDLPRAAQLTERTNQFNCCKAPRSEAEILALYSGATPQSEARIVRVRDRFGDYGLVGLTIFAQGDERLEVDTFLLSCRALGRGVEHRMLAALGELAGDRGLAEVAILFREAPRNRPAADFLAGIDGGRREALDDGAIYVFQAAELQDLTYRPQAASPSVESETAQPSGVGSVSIATEILGRVASELTDAEAILGAIDDYRRRTSSGRSVPYVAPRTEIEEEIAAIWSQLLGREEVSVEADFFHLGGDSLLGVQLISRVRQAFQLEVALRDFFGGSFTIARLAQTLEERQIENASEEDIEGILDELQGLSDDDIRELLAAEEIAGGGASA